MYLFFDTETTGLPYDCNESPKRPDLWPHLVQLAYQLYDKKGNLVSERNHVVKPNGYMIPEDSARIHGITHLKAHEVGIPLHDVLEEFNHHAEKATRLVAHNMKFDSRVVGAAFHRCGMKDPIPLIRKTCTMEETTEFCKIRKPLSNWPDDYKWPTLQELHAKLFGCGFDKAHDALVDMQVTARCYWELKRLKIL